MNKNYEINFYLTVKQINLTALPWFLQSSDPYNCKSCFRFSISKSFFQGLFHYSISP